MGKTVNWKLMKKLKVFQILFFFFLLKCNSFRMIFSITNVAYQSFKTLSIANMYLIRSRGFEKEILR